MKHATGNLLWSAFGGVAVVFMLSPLVLLVVFCFSANAVLTVPITGWTTAWFRQLFANPEFWLALRNSLIIAACVGVISTITGTMAAFALLRLRPAFSEATKAVIGLPVMLPPLVLALSLLTFASRSGIGTGLHLVVLGHLAYTQPFVLFIVHARMTTFNWAAVDSARDLGARPLKAFFDICLPIIRPTLIGASLISVALSFDDFIISLFALGGGNTLPTFLWGMLRKGVNPSINVAALVLVGLILLVSLAAMRATRYRG
jgi:spermidine/putrescine transport system permease protein